MTVGEPTESRLIAAPRPLVFKMWTSPTHLMHWWGPRDSTIALCELDASPGGAYRIHVRSADGVEHPFKGIYREIVEPERIVATGLNVRFEDQKGKTRVTVTGAEAGWADRLLRLEEHLTSKS